MRNLLLLLSVLILAAFFRFFIISSNPPALTWDEAAWGYNAYSIGIDGRDEFGKLLPLNYLESFGDFKPPVYAYLTVLPVKIFGLNEFSTRFASAFFGTLTILLVFFLTKRIFYNLSENQKTILAILSSFIIAISPWHILLSRAAFEANVATFFIILGVYLFLESHDSKWLFPISIVSFLVSMYTFNTARIVAPLIILVLFFSNLKYVLFSMKKQLLTGLILGGIIFLPLFLFLLTPQSKLRFNEVNIFSDGGVIKRVNQEVENDNNAVWSKILHNRRFAFSVEYLRHYFDNLSPDFLFIKGDGNPKFSIQDVGQMYIWEIPFFVTGILFLFKRKDGYWWIIPVWLLIGIIPAASARETPHALRIEAALPTFQILTAYGIFNFVNLIKDKSLKISFSFILLLIIFLNFIYFYHNYFFHYPKEFSGEWQYGYKQAIDFSNKNESKFDEIIMTEALGRPYIYTLFYEKYDPKKFRKEAVVRREALGFVHVNAFGKYKFSDSVSSEINKNKKILYVDSPNQVPEGAKILKTINLLNGSPVLVAYTL